HGLFEAYLLQRAKYIGPELDAGTDLAEFWRLLDHPHREALACERIGRRKPADAATGNQDRRLGVICFCPSCSNAILRKFPSRKDSSCQAYENAFVCRFAVEMEKPRMIARRHFLAGVGAASVLAAGGARAQELPAIRFVLDWKYEGEHAQFTI